MTTTRYRDLLDAHDAAVPILLQRGYLWTHDDIAAFLNLGKSATNQVMAAADFPAPVVGDRRYRRYIPDDVVAWALTRAEAGVAERRRLHHIQ